VTCLAYAGDRDRKPVWCAKRPVRTRLYVRDGGSRTLPKGCSWCGARTRVHPRTRVHVAAPLIGPALLFSHLLEELVSARSA